MNKMITKGLVSVAAASLLTSASFAGSSVTDPSTYATGAGYLDSYTAPSRDANITIQELGVAGFAASGYITIKLDANTRLGSNIGGVSYIPQSVLGTSSSPINIVEHNLTATSTSLYAEVNSSFWPAIINGLYTPQDTNVTHLGATTSGASVLKYSTLGASATNSDGNTTVGKIYYDSTTGETVITLAVGGSTSSIQVIDFDMNVSIDANVTGVMSLALSDGDTSGNNGLGVTAGTVKLYDVIKQPAYLTYNASRTAPNVTVADNQPILDFNVTMAAPWNETNGITADSSVYYTLTNAVWSADVNISDTNITTGAGTAFVTPLVNSNQLTSDQNVSLATVSSTYDRMIVDLNNSDSNVSVAILGSAASPAPLLNTTGKTLGTSVTAAITGTGKLAHMSLTTATLATIVADGVVTQEVDNNASRYTTRYIVPGRTEQALNDINISEQFASSFVATTGLNQVSMTLPTGYTFSSKPTVRIYSNTGHVATTATVTYNDENNLTAALGSSVATIQFATAGGDIALTTASGTKEMVIVSGLKVSVPSTATSGDVISLALAGNMFTSTKTLDVSTVNVGTVSSSTAAMSELNATVGIVGTGTSTAHNGYVAFDINESFPAQLTAGSTITFTLSDGTFAPILTPTTGDVSLAMSTPVGSDNNKTVTYTVSSQSVATPSGTRIALPLVSLATVSTAKTITATVAGTAGVVGTVNVVTTALGSATTATSIVAATKGSVDTTIGEIQILEGINSGFAATSTGFKFIAPVGVSFTGAYSKSTKQLTSATDTTTVFSAYPSTADQTGIVTTTFNTNDTLSIGLPISGSYIDTIKIKPIVNISTAAADGVQGIRIADVNQSGVIATSDLNALYVGTIPTLTAAAAATVDAAGTTSVVPTNATGTVTYASADTAIATVDAAGTVTVDANATAAATVVITATDSLTAQAASTTITVGTATPVDTTLSGDITLAAGWNFISSPVDGDVDLASVAAAGCSQVHTYDSTANWYGAAVTTGTLSAGASAVAYCDGTTTTVAYTGITANTTAFSMTSAITAASKGTVPTTHAAAAVGAKYAVVGTPTATTVADVVAAGAAGVMIYNATTQAYNFSSAYTGFTPTAADTDAIAAGTSFIIQTAE